MTIKRYPKPEEDHSWQSVLEIANAYNCVVKLGGRQTARRKARNPGRLVVNGVYVDHCFFAVV